jgi:hypothetical protein
MPAFVRVAIPLLACQPVTILSANFCSIDVNDLISFGPLPAGCAVE